MQRQTKAFLTSVVPGSWSLFSAYVGQPNEAIQVRNACPTGVVDQVILQRNTLCTNHDTRAVRCFMKFLFCNAGLVPFSCNFRLHCARLFCIHGNFRRVFPFVRILSQPGSSLGASWDPLTTALREASLVGVETFAMAKNSLNVFDHDLAQSKPEEYRLTLLVSFPHTMRGRMQSGPL